MKDVAFSGKVAVVTGTANSVLFNFVKGHVVDG